MRARGMAGSSPALVVRNWDASCELPLERTPDPFALVLFGATGDLAQRKLLPAIYSLVSQGLLSQPFALVAFARREGSDESFRESVRDAIRQFAPSLPAEGPAWDAFAANLYYHRSDFGDEQGYRHLDQRLKELDRDKGLKGNRLFYMAVPPDQFLPVAGHLGKAGLVGPYSTRAEDPWRRIIIEKPFGYDLESARSLNAGLREVFAEQQIFRIDHYLGKETVQNILVMRFANKLYELLWNQNVIDNVQITVAETLGMEGRGEYFDTAGIARDMVQNHVLQLLTLVAMEPPVSLDADSIRDEKVKVLRAIRPFEPTEVHTETVRGQYTDGLMRQGARESHAVGYTREEGVQPHSFTETYAAFRFFIDNWRWAGVPFYVRAGKRLPSRATEINIELKAMPDVLFARMRCVEVEPNRLTLRIQPDEGIVLRMSAKVPGPRMRVEPVDMTFGYAHEFSTAIPEAYERLILDAVLGEAALFARADEVEAAWSILTPIVREWSAAPHPPEPYFAGSWGPRGADDLLEQDGRRWHNPRGEGA